MERYVQTKFNSQIQNRSHLFAGIFIDHKNESIETLGYFYSIDSAANILGQHAVIHKELDTEFMYARFWEKTLAEYHLHQIDINIFENFNPIKSWLLVHIEWKPDFRRLPKHIENIS